MIAASRVRGIAALTLAGIVLAACTSSGDGATPSPSVPSVPASASGAKPTASATPTPTPSPPVLAPGRSNGRVLIVQQAEDAALVSGDQPIRLTLARTGNVATWFSAPPQRLSGTMSTEEALLTLGWRPADDGTTAALPNPRPNGVLAFTGGSLAFTVQRANVRADGTLVMDIRPIGAMPDTVESYGPVTLTLDGAPGLLVLDAALGELTVRVLVTGDANEQAVVQVSDASGEVIESGFVSPQLTTIDRWIDVSTGDTTWSDPILIFTPPARSKPGTVRITGSLTTGGTTSGIDRVIARWSLPLVR